MQSISKGIHQSNRNSNLSYLKKDLNLPLRSQVPSRLYVVIDIRKTKQKMILISGSMVRVKIIQKVSSTVLVLHLLSRVPDNYVDRPEWFFVYCRDVFCPCTTQLLCCIQCQCTSWWSPLFIFCLPEVDLTCRLVGHWWSLYYISSWLFARGQWSFTRHTFRGIILVGFVSICTSKDLSDFTQI